MNIFRCAIELLFLFLMKSIAPYEEIAPSITFALDRLTTYHSFWPRVLQKRQLCDECLRNNINELDDVKTNV